MVVFQNLNVTVHLFHFCCSWVITAAHCISGSAADYRIVAGDHDRSTHEGTEQTRTISYIQVNSHYSTDGDRDAALLQLASPLHLNDHVSPICLTDTEVPVGTNCVATGWGETESKLYFIVLLNLLVGVGYQLIRYGNS